MEKCYICSEESTKKITYSDSMGKKSTENRCDVCAEQLESNENNTIYKVLKCKNSTNFTDGYESEIHSSQHPDLIKSNNIMLN